MIINGSQFISAVSVAVAAQAVALVLAVAIVAVYIIRPSWTHKKNRPTQRPVALP